MFGDILRECVDGAAGAQGACLMGYDGIAVETYTRPDASVDPGTLGMELSVLIKDARTAVGQLEGGTAREIAFQADKLTIVVRLLNDNYFAVLAMAPDGNFGKGRFLLRLAAPKLIQALS